LAPGTTSSLFMGVECISPHLAAAPMLRFRISGGGPSSLTLPVIVPAVAGSTGIPPADWLELAGEVADSFWLLPQLASVIANATASVAAEGALACRIGPRS